MLNIFGHCSIPIHPYVLWVIMNVLVYKQSCWRMRCGRRFSCWTRIPRLGSTGREDCFCSCWFSLHCFESAGGTFTVWSSLSITIDICLFFMHCSLWWTLPTLPRFPRPAYSCCLSCLRSRFTLLLFSYSSTRGQLNSLAMFHPKVRI